MKLSQIRIGAFVHLKLTDGREYNHFIVDIQDNVERRRAGESGRQIIFAARFKPLMHRGPYWWLPIEFVMEHGTLIDRRKSTRSRV